MDGQLEGWVRCAACREARAALVQSEADLVACYTCCWEVNDGGAEWHMRDEAVADLWKGSSTYNGAHTAGMRRSAHCTMLSRPSTFAHRGAARAALSSISLLVIYCRACHLRASSAVVGSTRRPSGFGGKAPARRLTPPPAALKAVQPRPLPEVLVTTGTPRKCHSGGWAQAVSVLTSVLTGRL